MRPAVTALVAALASGCFTSVPDVQPADVNGKYTMFVENANNGCGFAGFDRAEERPRMTDATLDFSLYQSPGATKVTGQFEGLALIVLVPWFGSAQLTGTVDGNKLEIRAQAVNPQSKGTCRYNLEVRAEATVQKDRNLSAGVVHYRPQNVGSDPDCASLQSCETTQTFTATRVNDPTARDGGI
jgi:hypothetical protein